MKCKLFSVFVFLTSLIVFFGDNIYAQGTAIISGVVTDSSGKALDGVNVAVFGLPVGTITDAEGRYSLSVPAQTLKIIFYYAGLKTDTVNLKLKESEKRIINRGMKSAVHLLKEVDIQTTPLSRINMTTVNPKLLSHIPTPNQSVIDLIKTYAGVSSSNELSSGYSVRGGNYDENLVYVNDIEIYRPFLVRSGQQEGLSFPNSDMVSSIYFSAGGFDAVYGDKMSSVLDMQYRKPKKFGGAFNFSLLGGALELEGASKNQKRYVIGGFRYKSSSYLLSNLDVQGDYKPSFYDVQLLSGFQLDTNTTLELFGNYSRNNYTVIPSTRETEFGTVKQAFKLKIFFDGQEQDLFETGLGAVSLTRKPTQKLKLKLITSAFATAEEEKFDILGQYFLDQLESDLGSENFGNSLFNLGVGSFLDHARTQLTAIVWNGEHKGEYVNENIFLRWGAKYQREEIEDQLREWKYLDSAGFSVPTFRDTPSVNAVLGLNDFTNTRISISSNRYSAYLQNIWTITDTTKIILAAGVRAQYWDLNQEFIVSPRASFTYKPKWKRNLNFRFATGLYYQPPFYRELRDLSGIVHTDVKAQQSVHFVLGSDYNFLAFGREFKLVTEIYYKHLDNLIPYKIDNVRIRYLSDQTAKGYATGIDFRLNGEFVPGTESWASLSLLQTEEDIKGDYFYDYYNSDGEKIIPGYSVNDIRTDSVRSEPGYIPRPTDQRLTFGLFFQDYLPKFPAYKVYLNFLFGTGLPFGPPGKDRYKDILRIPPYRRADIGFSKQIIGEDVKRPPKIKLLRKFKEIWVNLEVYNLLQVNNTVSYIWVKDVTNRQYAVPNYLTSRQINVRLSFKF
ncbi:MAG TPA: TonB-dependent receptor [Bacteroidia bacterium]|nr:TonB-dependent receptor [Bacteroidia bacterium]